MTPQWERDLLALVARGLTRWRLAGHKRSRSISSTPIAAFHDALKVHVITVYRGSDYIEAQLLAGLLRQQGIEVFLQGALLQGAVGELPPMGHLAIMVDDADRSAAEWLIAAYERGEFMLDDEQPADDDVESDPRASDPCS